MNYSNILLDKIDEKMKQDVFDIFETSIPKSVIAKRRTFFRKMLNDKGSYLSFEITNDKVDKLIFAKFMKTVLFGEFINIHFFILNERQLNKRIVKNEISKVREFFKDKSERIFIDLPERDRRLNKTLKSIGFVNHGYLLKGITNDGLVYLEKELKKYDFSEYDVQEMKYQKDIGDVTKVNIEANNSDDSSLVTYDNKKKIDEIKKYYKMMCKDKAAWVLKKGKKTIGSIGLLYDIKQKGSAHVGNITILPKFQGKGLAKLLYYKAFCNLKERKVEIYTGNTSTIRVMKMAKGLRRTKAGEIVKAEGRRQMPVRR